MWRGSQARRRSREGPAKRLLWPLRDPLQLNSKHHSVCRQTLSSDAWPLRANSLRRSRLEFKASPPQTRAGLSPLSQSASQKGRKHSVAVLAHYLARRKTSVLLSANTHLCTGDSLRWIQNEICSLWAILLSASETVWSEKTKWQCERNSSIHNWSWDAQRFSYFLRHGSSKGLFFFNWTLEVSWSGNSSLRKN